MTNWFRNLRLQSKFFVILLFALLVVFCGAMITSRMTEQTYNDALYRRTVQLMTLFGQNVQSELENVTDTSFAIIADDVLQESLSQLKDISTASGERLTFTKRIEGRMIGFGFANDNVAALRVHSVNGHDFTRTLSGRSIPSRIFADYAQRVHDARGRGVWIPDASAPGSVLLLRDVRETRELTLESIATLALRVSMDRIVDNCTAPLRAMDMPLLCAIDFQGTRVYASDARIMKTTVEDGGFSLQKLGGETYFCVPYAPVGSDWSYIAALSYDAILTSLRRAGSIATIIAAGAFMLALALASLLISSIVRHFKLLIRKYDAFARGQWQRAPGATPYDRRRDEIGELHRQFDHMTDEHQRMIDEIYVKQQLLLEAQLRQLRAQIQPHFLYNTLESISCLADQCEDPRIATMATALGHMLRATLNDKRDMISVREDIAIAEQYLRIQRIRYEEQLSAAFEVDEAFMDAQIPAMTLQPLVENAVRHGAEEMLETCVIRIGAQRVGAYIDITVADNGPGMDEDILEKLQSGQVQAEGLSIGLRNIHQRLHLAFGDPACGVRVRRVEGQTRVIVRILAEVKEHVQAAACG